MVPADVDFLPGDEIELANRLAELWEELEAAGTAEQAAYQIACEQLGIEPDEGYALLALIDDSSNEE